VSIGIGKLFAGDKILKFNGQEVPTINDLIPFIQKSSPDGPRFLEVQRVRKKQKETEENEAAPSKETTVTQPEGERKQNNASINEESNSATGVVNLESEEKSDGKNPQSDREEVDSISDTMQSDEKEGDGDSDKMQSDEKEGDGDSDKMRSVEKEGEDSDKMQIEETSPPISEEQEKIEKNIDKFQPEKPESDQKEGDDSDDMQINETNSAEVSKEQEKTDEKVDSVIAPPGSLGLRINKNHEVLEVLPKSPLVGKIFLGDRVISINDIDITGSRSKDLAVTMSKMDNLERVLKVIRGATQLRDVSVPPVDRLGLVLRENEKGGYIYVKSLLADSIFKGKIFPGDRIVGINGMKVTRIVGLMPHVKDRNSRVLQVVTFKRSGGTKRKALPSDTDVKPSKRHASAREMSDEYSNKSHHVIALSAATPTLAQNPVPAPEEDPLQQETAVIASYKTIGKEKFISVIVPPGKLGIKLNKSHEVMDILSTSPLAGKVMLDDRLINIDEVDVRGKHSSSLIVLLIASQNRTRVLGIRRKTGKKVKVPTHVARDSWAQSRKSELEVKFPHLSRLGVPMGDHAADTSARCKVLSELLSYHESAGLANDVETSNGKFCHLVKIPKKGQKKREELLSSLDDVMSSLASICGGSEIDATDLLLEFLAKRSPTSYAKFSSNIRPAKKRKIEESKKDPDMDKSRREAKDTRDRPSEGAPGNEQNGTSSKQQISTVDLQMLNI
jgi:PDZ domain-containing secreted protein